MQIKTFTLAVSCGWLVCTSGCSVFEGKQNKSPDNNWSISKLWKKEYQKPASISIIWAPDVLTMTGKPPTRGFGGRVFFYNDRAQAVPVEGELIVHGYRGDPMLGESEQVTADKKFAFTAEQLTSHFSPSQLGASYSIWIPWDAADGLRDEITLIPTFIGEDGSVIQGSPAKLNLPGRSLDSLSAARERGHTEVPTQTVSYHEETISTNTMGSLPRLTTMTPATIELPPLATIGRPRSKSNASSQGFYLGEGNLPQMSEAPRTSASSSGFTLENNAPNSQPAPISQLPESKQVSPSTASSEQPPPVVAPTIGLQPAATLPAAKRFDRQPWQAELR